MITVYICDDNDILREKYSEMISTIAKQNIEEIELKEFDMGTDMLRDLEENPNKADIIFLDIIMPELNGVEVAAKLRERGCNSQIIFLTSTEEYVFDSYNVSPVQYLIKNVTAETEFKSTLLRAIDNAKAKETDFLSFDSDGDKMKIGLQDILYIEEGIKPHADTKSNTVAKSGTTICCESGIIPCSLDIREIIELLQNKCFSVVNSHCLINLQAVDRIDKDSVALRNETVIAIDSNYEEEFKTKFSDYLTQSF